MTAYRVTAGETRTGLTLTPDAMRHVKAWVAAAGIEAGPLFRGMLKGCRMACALDAGDVARVLNAMAGKAGLMRAVPLAMVLISALFGTANAQTPPPSPSAAAAAQAQQPASGSYDLAGARAAGVPDGQTADFLAPLHGYDLAGARAAGVPDSQTAEFLAALPIRRPPPPPPTNAAPAAQAEQPAPAPAPAPTDPYNVGAALKAGYSPSEIADYIGAKGWFDVAGARSAGYSDSEIVNHLASLPAPPPPPPANAAPAAQVQQPAPAPAPASAATAPGHPVLDPTPTRAPGAREAASVHDIYERARSSVVLLIGYDANNQPLALGSGFFVKSDIIATNMHVIEGASSVKAKYMSGDVATITTISGIDSDHDVALLESPIHQSGLPLQLSNPDIGEPIVAIGNPRGLEGTVSTGIVSGIRRDKADTYYQITAPISPGSSGGPIINQDGQVIGISTFYLAQGQNLNFAVPAIYVDHLLATPRKIALSARTQLSKPRVVVQGHENVSVIDPFISGAVDDLLEASVFNRTENTIKHVRIIAILHKETVGGPIVDYINLEVSDNIPPHLSKRFSHHDSDLAGHGDDGQSSGGFGVRKGRWVAEFRVLDYEIIKDIAGDLGIPR